MWDIWQNDVTIRQYDWGPLSSEVKATLIQLTNIQSSFNWSNFYFDSYLRIFNLCLYFCIVEFVYFCSLRFKSTNENKMLSQTHLKVRHLYSYRNIERQFDFQDFCFRLVLLNYFSACMFGCLGFNFSGNDVYVFEFGFGFRLCLCHCLFRDVWHFSATRICW